jgi:hypothetical protein
MAHLSIDKTHHGQGRKTENTDSKSPQRTHTPRLGRHPAALSSIELDWARLGSITFRSFPPIFHALVISSLDALLPVKKDSAAALQPVDGVERRAARAPPCGARALLLHGLLAVSGRRTCRDPMRLFVRVPALSVLGL